MGLLLSGGSCVCSSFRVASRTPPPRRACILHVAELLLRGFLGFPLWHCSLRGAAHTVDDSHSRALNALGGSGLWPPPRRIRRPRVERAPCPTQVFAIAACFFFPSTTSWPPPSCRGFVLLPPLLVFCCRNGGPHPGCTHTVIVPTLCPHCCCLLCRFLTHLIFVVAALFCVPALSVERSLRLPNVVQSAAARCSHLHTPLLSIPLAFTQSAILCMPLRRVCHNVEPNATFGLPCRDSPQSILRDWAVGGHQVAFLPSMSCVCTCHSPRPCGCCYVRVYIFCDLFHGS